MTEQNKSLTIMSQVWEYAVVQLDEALPYKLEGHGSIWLLGFFIDLILRATEMSTRDISWT